ncbi:MAG: glutamine-hydrolyzing carbamoyl-phosphate synthase small subunit [Bacteroidales bacterium]|nr:glutamine-hydrolyzing carbamoyl-phosphate synthase small subunit [Bacteroidales bacterium]
MKKVTLVLSDGTQFRGESFGYENPVAGEVVFNTAMTGYPESLTDPAFKGQIITFTYPLVGNYGVPPIKNDENSLSTFMQSDHIHASAIVVCDYSNEYSHWNAVESLADWLKREKVPAITGIDTRHLTKHLRENGVMMGKIIFDDQPNNIPADTEYAGVNYVEQVSCKEVIKYNQGAEKKVVVVDCGVTTNIIRQLLKYNVEVIRVPWNYDFNTLEYNGLLISSGPGDPTVCTETIANIKKAMENPNKPILGACMGNLLVALASGASVYKLKYGHRGSNQPVRIGNTNKCLITSQNHGYAIDNNTIGKDWEAWFSNLNDGSNEGMKHKTNPWYTTQFLPTDCTIPTDTDFLFQDFINKL